MKKLDENFNKSLKYRDIDPYGEEDWDEYEIKNDDAFYFFVSKDNTIYPGVGIAKYKGDKFTLDIKDSTDSELIGKNIVIDENSTANINNKQFDTRSIKVNKDSIIVSLVNDFKFGQYYKNIHEVVRKFLHSKVQNLSGQLGKTDSDINQIESKVITLKKEMKSEDEFPKVEDINLKDNEYVIIKTKKNQGTGVISINIGISELSDKPDDKNGYNFINKETGEKGPYILANYEKLKTNGHLLLKTKRNPDDKTYITRKIDLYDKFINRIVDNTNDEMKAQIDKFRKQYRDGIEKSEKQRIELKSLREKYLEFDFGESVTELKAMIKKSKK